MPDSSPYFAGVLASYFLRVAAAYAVCWLLSRLSPSPQRRFLLWLLFLLGAAGYWVAMLLPLPAQVSATPAVGSLPIQKAPHTLFFPPSWAPVLALVARVMAGAYAAGVLLFGANVLWQHLGLRRALRHALEPSRGLASLFSQMCHGFGVRRCRLLILPQLSSPATAGWLRPCILLPEVCEEFKDSSQLADVLYHELTHVVRRDYLWAAVSDLARCLLFFHPAVWRARQHMRVQRELACDVAVVSGRPEHCADYAQSLTRFARLRMLQLGKSLGVDFAASASILGMRVRAVLSQRPPACWWRAGLRSLLSLGLLVSFGLLWPVFGVVAEFAAVPQPIPGATRTIATRDSATTTPAAQVAVRARPRAAAGRRAINPPQLRAQSPELYLPPPAAKEPRAPMIAISSAEFGPQSNDFEPASPDGGNDRGAPNWPESRPVSRRRVTIAFVVEHVATQLAQISRAQMGREGHDHPGR